MTLIKDEEGVLHLENYVCDVCGQYNGLNEAAYKIVVDGEEKAGCGKCYRLSRIYMGSDNT